MNKKILVFMVWLIFPGLISIPFSFAQQAVTISIPGDGDTISGPVEVCMNTWGVEVEPAKNGVAEGKGHHHLLVDVDLPADLNQPLPKDANHIHMGDGSFCKIIKLSPGKHTIRTLFGTGRHVPYAPPLTDAVEITVE